GERGLLLHLASLQIATGDLAGAEARLAEVLARAPDDAEALILEADAAAAAGDSAREERTLRAALAKQDQDGLKKRLAGALGKQARALADGGDAKGARGKAEEALKLDARNGRAADALGRALWAEGDRAGAAKWLATLPDQPDGEVSGEGLRLSAELALE